MNLRSLVVLFTLLMGLATAHAESIGDFRALSFVLLKEAKLPDPRQVQARLKQRLGDSARIERVETDGEKVIIFHTQGGRVLVGLLEAPLPSGQIDDLCSTAWYWPQACAATAAHRAHLVTSVMDTTLDPLDASLLLTQVVASVMDDNAIASYWNASLQSREAVLEQTRAISRSGPPVLLWVNFRISRDPASGFSVSTQGMGHFGHHEIEAKDVRRSGNEVFVLLVGMAQYLLDKGAVIKDGDTIGGSPALGIHVHQGPSYWRPGATVYRVEWPETESGTEGGTQGGKGRP